MRSMVLVVVVLFLGCACQIGMSDRAIANQCKECYQQKSIPIIWTGSYGAVWSVRCIDTSSAVAAPLGRFK